jgi:hypothetical protein
MSAEFTRLTRVAFLTPATLALALSCAACSAPRRASPSGSATTPEGTELQAASAPALDLTSTRAWPEFYRADSLWARAARGDVIDRYTLAEREGASGLMTALALGGDLGRTALAALPLAPDRRAASGELCRLVASAHAPTRGWLLAALHELSAPVAGALDSEVDAATGCHAVLHALAQDSSLDAGERDLAASTLVYLAVAATP